MANNFTFEKRDLYVREADELADYVPDQTVLVDKKYLHLIPGYKPEEETPEAINVLNWYPYVNSYYPYTEDVDAFARVNHLLATRPSFASMSSTDYRNTVVETEDGFSEKSVQLRYLQTNPVSFFILGKPGIGEIELGRHLAEYWKCIYIDPDILIQQEIESGTRAGQCIEFNLRCGRAIGMDVILRLLEKRVKSQSCQHRGFIICGFPVIPNDLYEEDPVSSESAVFNVQEIFEELLDKTVEIGIPPSKPRVSISSKTKFDDEMSLEEDIQDTPNDLEDVDDEEDKATETVVPETIKQPAESFADLGSAVFNICGQPEIGTNYEEQLNFLFSLVQNPFLIIYITCSSSDVINKRNDYRFDLYSNRIIDLQRESSTKTMYNYFESGISNNEAFEEYFDTNYLDVESARLRHLVKLPHHFPANVSSQLNRYHISALNLIEEKVLLHDPQYFIKVDGRTNPQRMFYIVKCRLKVLPLQKVILPIKLNISVEGMPGEDHELVSADLNSLTLEEGFKELSNRQTASPIYKWMWSDWGTKCPVAMKEDIYKDGEVKYAVGFMNKIFFLSSQENYLKFCNNPRPYLLPPFPRPSCKIFVFGPKRTGKTAVSLGLSYWLNGTTLHLRRIFNDYVENQRQQHKEKIKQSTIAEALAILNEKRRRKTEELEGIRRRETISWMSEVRKLLKDIADILAESSREDSMMSSFPLPMGKATSLVDMPIRRFHKEILQLGIPDMTDEELCSSFNTDEKILEFIPERLTHSIVVEPATVFDEFVKNYVATKMSELDLDTINFEDKDAQEKMFENALKDAEDAFKEKGNKCGGWIIDGMVCESNLLENLYPDFMADEIILLKDNDDFKFLLDAYWDFDKLTFKDFKSFFHSIGKDDVAWRSPSETSNELYRTGLAKSFIDELIDENNFPYETHEGVTATSSSLENYKEHLREFNTKWGLVEHFFENRNIKPIEINVAYKSIPDVLKEVINALEDKYRRGASELTEVDRAEEVKNFGDQTVQDDEELGEGDQGSNVGDLLEQNRRYGATLNFCPVTFTENWVLWKGKEDFAAKFENNIYLLSSEQALKNFLKFPRNYIPTVPYILPPFRICVVGVFGTEKSMVSKALSSNLGIHLLDYESALKRKLNSAWKGDLDDILHNEDLSETILYKYLNSDEPLPTEILDELIGKLWFKEPMKIDGFVINNFPKRPSDVEYMVGHKTIPNVIIHIVADENTYRTELIEERLGLWHKKTSEETAQRDEKRLQLIFDQEEQRKLRYQQLIDEKHELRYSSKIKSAELNNPVDVNEIKSISQISFDSVADQQDVAEVEKILNEEFPKIVFENEIEPETVDEAKERIEEEIDNAYAVQTEFLSTIKEACLVEEIPWIDVMQQSSSEKTLISVFLAIEKINSNRNSLFERCYEISTELAERLLSCGYYFLSKFGKTCPVQYHENINPIQMFLPMEQNFQIFPVIHRQHIYFLGGLNSLRKFKNDPLKYANVPVVNYPLIPFRIAITGPPKCGKTILANRFRDNFGFKVVSRGSAIRYVLGYLPHSELAKNMETVLRQGWEVTDEMVIRSVEAVCFDCKVVTQGVVFDGFPDTIFEVRHLSYVGLVPNLVIDLEATQAQIFECLSNDCGRRGLPLYSQHFMKHLLDEWFSYAGDFRTWLDGEYQIIGKQPINESKWSVWTAAFNLTTSVCFEIKHYYKHITDDWPLRLANMLVTPFEFLERQSSFKNYCPCCLHFSNILESGGDPPDRTGLVQYREYFYWLCPNHIEMFLKMPDQFIVPYNNHTLPQFLPTIVTLSEIPANVYEHGRCIMCYQKNRVMTTGSISLAVSFNKQVYLFNCHECLKSFLKSPNNLTEEVSFVNATYPPLNYRELPVLGMLEQYVAKYIVKGLSVISRQRPVLPGLSIETSAAVALGLYLKTSNTSKNEEYKLAYEDGLAQYDKRRTSLIKYLDNMKSVINPYLYYEEPMPKFVIPSSECSNSSRSLSLRLEDLIDSQDKLH